MVRFSKKLDTDDPTAAACTTVHEDGLAYILIHEGLRPFPTLTTLVLLHEMTHYQDGCVGGHDNRFHKKMLSILKREPRLL